MNKDIVQSTFFRGVLQNEFDERGNLIIRKPQALMNLKDIQHAISGGIQANTVDLNLELKRQILIILDYKPPRGDAQIESDIEDAEKDGNIEFDE